jgi:hydroxyethylthiazole kinase-like uncharacterized protein yjeF
LTDASPLLLLTPEEMARVDARAPALGVSTRELMENAGRAVADAIVQRFSPRPTAILCGPGNNGGDGFVVARVLSALGWDVWVETLGDLGALKGDAKAAAAAWTGRTFRIGPDNPDAALIVDALFGAGLSRPLEGEAARLAETLSRTPARIVAIDAPSGVRGDGRAPEGAVVHAGLTVTFCRKKPGHVLEPSRSLCGEIVLADIGLPDEAVAEIGARAWENGPALWLDAFPRVTAASHKHSRGRLSVASGGASTSGAARLAALAGARIGAGYVTLICPPSALLVNAAHLTATLLKTFDGVDDLAAQGERDDAFVIGPAFGLTDKTKAAAAALAKLQKPLVLDADALTIHADAPEALFAVTHPRCVLTPHAGEFARLFPDLAAAPLSKIEKARAAAHRARAIVLFKGADTVIAAPDGRAAVNVNASPYLATAGAGDVLAGMIGGLMAQHMAPFEAACAGAWIHGAAGGAFGPGLIADDLPALIPGVLRALLAGA